MHNLFCSDPELNFMYMFLMYSVSPTLWNCVCRLQVIMCNLSMRLWSHYLTARLVRKNKWDVWFSDLNYMYMYSIDFDDLISLFPPQFWFWLRRYTNCLKHSRQFDHISKHQVQSWKYMYDAKQSIFDKFWGVWKCGQTLSWVFDTSCQSKSKLRRKWWYKIVKLCAN